MKSTTELKALIDFLRAEGVSSYEEDGIRISLTAKPAPELAPHESKPAVTLRDKLYGLTEEEQIDLFNTVVSKAG